MTEPNSSWIHDLLAIYSIGLIVGLLAGFVRWVLSERLGFFEALAPAVVWPIAILKESWKYLKK